MHAPPLKKPQEKAKARNKFSPLETLRTSLVSEQELLSVNRRNFAVNVGFKLLQKREAP